MLASDGLPEQVRNSPAFTLARRHIPEMEMTTTNAREQITRQDVEIKKP